MTAARGHVHEQGRGGDARARRGAARRRLPRRVALDVPLAVRAAASARRRRRSACRATSSSTTRPTRSRSSSRRCASWASTTSWCRRGRRCRGSARPRTAWRARSRSRGGWNSARRADRPRSTSGTSTRCATSNALDFDDLLLKTVELFENIRAGPRALRAEVPVRDGRRVPGHEPAAVPADPAPRRAPPQPLRRRRSGSVDLQVARRRPAQHPRLRARLPRGDASSGSSRTTARRRSSSTRRRAVIRQNRNRKDKRLWTDREGGAKIVYFRGNDELEEADFITRTIKHARAERRRRARWRCSIAPTRSRARSKTR